MDWKLELSKIEAAKRQLEKAIDIYFDSGEPVSIHTLAAAAHGIISDVNRSRRGSPMMTETMVKEWVRPGYQEIIQRKMREAQNFFKHADRDADAILTFRPAQSEFLLFDASRKYQELAEQKPVTILVYMAWFLLLNKDAFILPEFFRTLVESLGTSFSPYERRQFYNEALPAFAQALGMTVL